MELQIFSVIDIINSGLAYAVHDISDGGVTVALSEMCFENNVGCDIKIPGKTRKDKLLFSETGGFILEVSESNCQKFENVLNKYSCEFSKIGSTNSSGTIRFNDVIEISIESAKDAWTNGLRDKLL